jgi:actin-related protein 3
MSDSDACMQCRGIKEKHCYVCKDMNRELKKFKDPAVTNCTAATYAFKDKQTGKSVSLSVQQERFQAPELYFQPQLANLDMPALPKLVDQAILKSPIDARRRLYSSIWLSVSLCDFCFSLHAYFAMPVPL